MNRRKFHVCWDFELGKKKKATIIKSKLMTSNLFHNGNWLMMACDCFETVIKNRLLNKYFRRIGLATFNSIIILVRFVMGVENLDLQPVSIHNHIERKRKTVEGFTARMIRYRKWNDLKIIRQWRSALKHLCEKHFRVECSLTNIDSTLNSWMNCY